MSYWYRLFCVGVLALQSAWASSPQITGGERDDAKRFPSVYHVLMQQRQPDGEIKDGTCTGVAINGGTTLLTARHCFGLIGVETFSIALSNCPKGAFDTISDGCETRRFSRQGNDVALINGQVFSADDGSSLRLHVMPRINGKTRDIAVLAISGSPLAAWSTLHTGDIFSDAYEAQRRGPASFAAVGYGVHGFDGSGEKYIASLPIGRMEYIAEEVTAETPWHPIGLVRIVYKDMYIQEFEGLWDGDSEQSPFALGRIMPGDSGGPLFIAANGAWELVALTTGGTFATKEDQALFTLVIPSAEDRDPDVLSAARWLVELQTAYATGVIDAFVVNTVDTGGIEPRHRCLIAAPSRSFFGGLIGFGVLFCILFGVRRLS